MRLLFANPSLLRLSPSTVIQCLPEICCGLGSLNTLDGEADLVYGMRRIPGACELEVVNVLYATFPGRFPREIPLEKPRSPH